MTPSHDDSTIDIVLVIIIIIITELYLNSTGLFEVIWPFFLIVLGSS